MEEKFDRLFQELRESQEETRRFRQEVEQKFEASIAEVKREVNIAQARTSEDMARKIGSTSYQFKKKGHEHQYRFNCGVEEPMSLARADLSKLNPTSAEQKAALESAGANLEEGMKVLATRQKHIKIADRSEHGWGTVAHYQEDPLASSPEDEKEIERAETKAEKDVKKETERANKASYKRRGGDGRKRRFQPYPQWNDHQAFNSNGYFDRREQWGPPPANMVPQRPNRFRVVGPCFQCGGYGHIAKFCSVTNRPYPFSQSVVSSAEVCEPSPGLAELSLSHRNVDGIVASKITHSVCVNEWVGLDQVLSKECVDGPSVMHANEDKSILDTKRDYNLNQFWEVEGQGPGQIMDVQGRLKQSLSYWRDVLEEPPYILDCIENGYRLPLKFIPPSHIQHNHQSSQTHHSFVDEAISSLSANRCIAKVDAQPHVCSPLSVVSNAAGKLRLVLNLRYVNQFLHVMTFKYEDLRVAALMFEKFEFMFKFDLKSGYHHVDIHPECYKFLGFQWREIFYVFTVLPFGLSSACYLFTKLLRPHIRLWRGRGLKAIVYLDDGIVAVRGKDRAIRESTVVKRDLENAGFVINIVKSQWDPSHSMEWLGFIIDLSKGEFSVPDEKISRLKSKLLEIKSTESAGARKIASITGSIISMSLALGSVSRLMTRSLYAVLSNRNSWWQELPLTTQAQVEVCFWLERISEFNGQNIWPKLSALRVVYSDASSTGFGGYTVEHGNLVANGQWSAPEAAQSSTWRELRAVRLVLESFQGKLANERVRWFTDNQNVVRIVQHGSPKVILQAEALGIFSLCVNNSIRLEPEWIPRELNELADYYSRIMDHNDYMLNPSVFAWLDELWGPHSVDRFASPSNAHLDRFNTRYWASGSEAVDAFTCD